MVTRVRQLQRGVMAILLLTAAWAGADVPTYEQQCVMNRAARCRLSRVEYELDGPCPPNAETLRQYKDVDCSKPPPDAPPPPAKTEPTPPSASVTEGKSDLQRLATLYAPAALTGLVVLVLTVLRFRSLTRRGVPAGTVIARFAICTTGAFLAGTAAAVVMFGTTLARFHNTDTAGPAIIAFLASVGTFSVVVPMVMFAIGVVLNRTPLRLP